MNGHANRFHHIRRRHALAPRVASVSRCARVSSRDARDGYATSALDAIAGSSPKLLSSGSMLSRTAVPAACARPRQLPRGCSPHVVHVVVSVRIIDAIARLPNAGT